MLCPSNPTPMKCSQCAKGNQDRYLLCLFLCFISVFSQLLFFLHIVPLSSSVLDPQNSSPMNAAAFLEGRTLVLGYSAVFLASPLTD